jgi:NADH-quinone oxidoreductase subunit K
MTVPLSYYLVLGAILFTTGTAGVLTRKNPLIVFMSVELMFNAVNLTLITFSRMWGSVDGQVIALFILVMAAAEVVVGLAIIVTIFRSRKTVDVDEVSSLHG